MSLLLIGTKCCDRGHALINWLKLLVLLFMSWNRCSRLINFRRIMLQGTWILTVSGHQSFVLLSVDYITSLFAKTMCCWFVCFSFLISSSVPSVSCFLVAYIFVIMFEINRFALFFPLAIDPEIIMHIYSTRQHSNLFLYFAWLLCAQFYCFFRYQLILLLCCKYSTLSTFTCQLH